MPKDAARRAAGRAPMLRSPRTVRGHLKCLQCLCDGRLDGVAVLAPAVLLDVDPRGELQAIQVGKASKRTPTRLFMTSNLTMAARAGALRYNRPMKNSVQATEVRAPDTEGAV